MVTTTAQRRHCHLTTHYHYHHHNTNTYANTTDYKLTFLARPGQVKIKGQLTTNHQEI